MFPNEVYDVVFEMLDANFVHIQEQLDLGKFGMAAHYDSKNTALIEFLEHDLYGAKKMAKLKSLPVRERLKALKKDKK